MALIRHPSVRRLVVVIAWLAAALAFAHLSLDSTRPRSVDLHGWMAVAAAAAVVLAGAGWFVRRDGMRAVSAVAAVLTSGLALVLVVARAAHETGIALLIVSLFIAVVSLVPTVAQDGIVTPPKGEQA
jgi:hypothetical protein